MEYETEVLEIIRRAAARHANDIEKAAEVAERDIRRLPNFNELVEQLVKTAILRLVHLARASANVTIRRASGGNPRVIVGDSEELRQIADECIYLNYCIGSQTLGMLTGAELVEVADSEEAVAEGHLFNVKLARYLKRLVPDDKRVKDVISETRMATIFRKLQTNRGRGAA